MSQVDAKVALEISCQLCTACNFEFATEKGK